MSGKTRKFLRHQAEYLPAFAILFCHCIDPNIICFTVSFNTLYAHVHQHQFVVYLEFFTVIILAAFKSILNQSRYSLEPESFYLRAPYPKTPLVQCSFRLPNSVGARNTFILFTLLTFPSIMFTPGILPLMNSSNFQIRNIPATNEHISGNNNPSCSMVVPHPSLEHQERKLFAPRKFLKSVTLRLSYLWVSLISFIISFNRANNFFMFQKKSNLLRSNKENDFRGQQIR